MPAGSGSKPESIHSNFVLAGQYEGSEWVSVAGEGAIDENTCSHSYMFSYWYAFLWQTWLVGLRMDGWRHFLQRIHKVDTYFSNHFIAPWHVSCDEGILSPV